MGQRNRDRGISRQLKEIACEFSAEYLDVDKLFVDAQGIPKKGYLSDNGVHLAEKGHKVWAREMGAVLIIKVIVATRVDRLKGEGF